MDLEKLLSQTREKVEGTKAACSRAADLRRQLDELREEEEVDQYLDKETDQVTPPPSSDIGALVAALIQSAVSLAVLVIYLPLSALTFMYIPMYRFFGHWHFLFSFF